ncbi:hypothetical protein [Oceanithermus sp.]
MKGVHGMVAASRILDILFLFSFVALLGHAIVLWRLLARRPLPSRKVSEYANAFIAATTLPIVIIYFMFSVYREESAISNAFLIYFVSIASLPLIYRLFCAKHKENAPSKVCIGATLAYGLIYAATWLGLCWRKADLLLQLDWVVVALSIVWVLVYVLLTALTMQRKAA